MSTDTLQFKFIYKCPDGTIMGVSICVAEEAWQQEVMRSEIRAEAVREIQQGFIKLGFDASAFDPTLIRELQIIQGGLYKEQMTTSQTKDVMYLRIAEELSKSSHCLRSHFGVVIVRDDMIVGTGYNGPARRVAHCEPCLRVECASGVGYEKCIAVHAEVNAVLNGGGRRGCLGATLYISSHNKPFDDTVYNDSMGYFPCNSCARTLVNAGIKEVVQVQHGKIIHHQLGELVEQGKVR